MKHKLLLSLLIFLLPLETFSQDFTNKLSEIIQNTDVSGQWYLAYNYDDSDKINRFELKRGYFTVKTKLNDMFSARYTQDITLDQEGGDMGNVEMRLKYLYMKMKLNEVKLLKDTYFEFGLVHRPWLDFEEHINTYRVQGTMFAERYRLINSADFGITYVGLLGGKIDTMYQKTVNKTYPGKHGSFALGVYNGGGYHAIEKNDNKTIEGRVTLRPLPSFFPGLQFSYSFAYGKANSENNKSDFNMNLFFVSSESLHHVLTLQYYFGYGDFSGRYIDNNKVSYKNNGYSLFGELKELHTKLALFVRYDYFTSYQTTNVKQKTILGGIAYRFLKNKILLDYNQYETADKKVNTYELALEIKF